MILERYVTTPDLERIHNDAYWLAWSLKRLGELHEARGDHRLARSYYTRFADLWKECDPELRPQVTGVRRRLQSLDEAGGRLPRGQSKTPAWRALGSSLRSAAGEPELAVDKLEERMAPGPPA